MSKALITMSLLLLVTCAAPPSNETAQAVPGASAKRQCWCADNLDNCHDDWAAPSAAGPVLIGVVTHPDGTPLADIQVTPHGGFATRFPGTPVRTDSLGRYRFEPPLSGSIIQGDDGEMSALYIGVCVGSVSGVNPPVYLPWTDITVQNAANVVERLDFTFDPESVPLEVRG